MGMILFFIFLITDFIIVLVCKFSYGKRDQYSNGMIMGVHIPANKVDCEEVQQICKKSHKTWRMFQWIHLILGSSVCVIALFHFELFVIIWMIWLFAYIGGLYCLILISHRQMYQLKLKNQWINEKTKHIICIDTKLTALADKMAYSWGWHLPVILIILGSGIWLWKDTNWFWQGSGGWIIAIVTGSAMLIFLCLHLWIAYKQTVVYSQNTEVNQSINRLIKRTWSIALLIANWVNGISWCFLMIQAVRNGCLNIGDYGIYSFLQILGALEFLFSILYISKKKEMILKTDEEPLYVDDDEYWKNGWYSNPSDPHLLVQDRMSSTNFVFNMAHRSAKFICAILTVVTVAVIVWVGSFMISSMNIQIVCEINETNVLLNALDYECNFRTEEIQSVEIIQEIPKESFMRTNGASTDKYSVGHFKGKVTGNCMMFLYKGYAPILKITLPGQVVFFNSNQSGVVEEWYQNFKIFLSRSGNGICQ